MSTQLSRTATPSHRHATPIACAHGLTRGVEHCRSPECAAVRGHTLVEVDVVGRPTVLLWRRLTPDEVDVARDYAAGHGLHLDLCDTPMGAAVDARLTVC